MRKLMVLCLVVGLAAGTSAQAQFGGGGGGGHRHGGGGSANTGSSTPPSTASEPKPAPTPTNQVVIVGVVQALGPEPDRVKITYGAVDDLNWPAGTTLFVVTTPKLLDGVTLGEKVRFKIESQHIYELTPF
jgi:Cu/Ag efflux protein CusF